MWGAEEGTMVAGCSVGYWRASKEQGEMEGSIVSCRIISCGSVPGCVLQTSLPAHINDRVAHINLQNIITPS